MSTPKNPASDVISSNKAEAINLTAYTGGPAVIREVRRVTLPKGKSKVFIGGLPKEFVGGSQTIVSVGGTGKIKFGTRSLRPANLTGNALLQKSIGSEITLVEETKTGEERRTTGVLVDIVDGRTAILSVEGKTLIMPITPKYELGAGIPAGVSNLTVLAIEQDVENEGTFDLKLLYETKGLNWRPVYELFYNREKGTLDRFACYVELPNNAGATFADAAVRLIAGYNHSDAANLEGLRKHAAPAAAGFAARSVHAESVQADAEVDFEAAESETVGDSKMYKLNDKYTLESGVPNNPALFVSADVPIKHEYHAQYGHYYLLGSGQAETDLPKAGAVVKLRGKNNKDSKLGTDMPAAEVRVFEPDSQGEMQKTQSSTVESHVSVGEDFCLTLRNPSKDIKVVRQLLSEETDPEPVIEEETEQAGKKKVKKTIKVKPRYTTTERKIVVYNYSDKEVEVNVHDHVGVKELEILSKSHDFIAAKDAAKTGSRCYVVKVPAKSKGDAGTPGTFTIAYKAKWCIN